MGAKFHRCPTCGTKHSRPKASNALISLAWCAALATAQGTVALTIDGWAAWVLGAIAVRNALIFVFMLWGLAKLAEFGELKDPGGDV